MQNLIESLQTMLGTGFKVQPSAKRTDQLNIMTPFIDLMGDNLVIYVQLDPTTGQYRYTDGGDVATEIVGIAFNDADRELKLQKVKHYADYYAVQFEGQAPLHRLCTAWLDQAQLLEPKYFYPLLQTLSDSCTL